jgi:hypothetical protein
VISERWARCAPSKWSRPPLATRADSHPSTRGERGRRPSPRYPGTSSIVEWPSSGWSRPSGGRGSMHVERALPRSAPFTKGALLHAAAWPHCRPRVGRSAANTTACLRIPLWDRSRWSWIRRGLRDAEAPGVRLRLNRRQGRSSATRGARGRIPTAGSSSHRRTSSWCGASSTRACRTSSAAGTPPLWSECARCDKA